MANPELSDAVLRTMAQIAIEKATEDLAQVALSLAEAPEMKKITGSEALRAFANTIRARNKELYGKVAPPGPSQ